MLPGHKSVIMKAVNSLTYTLCDRCHLRNETNENGMQGTARSNNSAAAVGKTCMVKKSTKATIR